MSDSSRVLCGFFAFKDYGLEFLPCSAQSTKGLCTSMDEKSAIDVELSSINQSINVTLIMERSSCLDVHKIASVIIVLARSSGQLPF